MDDEIVKKLYRSPKIIHPVIDVILGVYHRYPLCCIASYTWKTVTNGHSQVERDVNISGYKIPCRFHIDKLNAKLVKTGFDLDDFYD